MDKELVQCTKGSYYIAVQNTQCHDTKSIERRHLDQETPTWVCRPVLVYILLGTGTHERWVSVQSFIGICMRSSLHIQNHSPSLPLPLLLLLVHEARKWFRPRSSRCLINAGIQSVSNSMPVQALLTQHGEGKPTTSQSNSFLIVKFLWSLQFFPLPFFNLKMTLCRDHLMKLHDTKLNHLSSISPS